MISFLFFCCLSGVGLGVVVRQSPPEFITNPGQKVQIFCSHDQTDYRVMLWYQRSPGDTAMKLIGYLNFQTVQLEDPYRNNFSISGDLGGNSAKNGSLIIKNNSCSEVKMIVLFFICCLAGDGLGLEVRQSASELITNPGDTVHIFCSHDKTDYRVMLWYQRSPGDTAMKLIGYLYFKDVTMEKPYDKNFNISGDMSGTTAKNGSLIINLAETEHSAVYYCAAREAHRQKSPLYLTKTLHNH
ncbi:Immunoglobulin lambda variable 3-25 [Channa argus]|nr:Immunoglobulin lambda variable 3-25 [Channa argus]